MTEELNDLRPAGWTEALALEFIADSRGDPSDLVTFAQMFSEGEWPGIQKEFPEFEKWLFARDS